MAKCQRFRLGRIKRRCRAPPCPWIGNGSLGTSQRRQTERKPAIHCLNGCRTGSVDQFELASRQVLEYSSLSDLRPGVALRGRSWPTPACDGIRIAAARSSAGEKQGSGSNFPGFQYAVMLASGPASSATYARPARPPRQCHALCKRGCTENGRRQIREFPEAAPTGRFPGAMQADLHVRVEMQ
jgi:hypothetical protein